MRRRACSTLLGLALGALLWSAVGPGPPPPPRVAARGSAAVPIRALAAADRQAGRSGTLAPARYVEAGGTASTADLPTRILPPPPAAARPFGLVLLLGAVGIVFGALRLLPAGSLARVLALGWAPAAVLAGGYLLLAGRPAGDTSAVRPSPTAPVLAVPADVASVERGRALFAANCVTCHGPQGRGDGPLAPTLNPRPANLADSHMAAHRDADLYGFISNGIPGSAMGAWDTQLTERQRRDLVAYIRTFAPVAGVTAGTPAGAIPAAGTRPPARLSDDPVPATLGGQLIYAADGRLWSLSAQGGDPVDLTPGRSRDTLAAEPALAPDGVTLAFTLVALPALGSPGMAAGPPGTDIYTLDLRDGSQRLVLGHDQPAALIESLNWVPDGRALVYAYSRPILSAAGQLTGTQREVQRLDLATGRRVTLVADALWPALSPDGTLLAYVASDPQTFETTLWLANGDGSARRQLVGTEGGFSDFLAPRFSPDGTRILFSAAGGPGVEQPRPSPPSGNLPARLREWLIAPLRPPGAAAHGLPGDLWLVGHDGRRLQRLTALYEDQPIGAWSRDGRWIAIIGGGGIYFVPPDGTLVVRRSRSGGAGAFVWHSPAPGPPSPTGTPQR